MKRIVKITILSVFLVILLSSFSSAALDKYYWYLSTEESTSCLQSDLTKCMGSVCQVDELSDYWICTRDFNNPAPLTDRFSQQTNSLYGTPGPNVELLDLWSGSNVEGAYIKAKVRFPSVNEETALRLYWDRTSTGDADSNFFVHDLIPAAHLCTDVSSTGQDACTDVVEAPNVYSLYDDFSGYDIIADEITGFDKLHGETVELRQLPETLGDPIELITSLSSTEANFAQNLDINGNLNILNTLFVESLNSPEDIISDTSLTFAGVVYSSLNDITLTNPLINLGLEVLGNSDLGSVSLIENIEETRYYYYDTSFTNVDLPYCYSLDHGANCGPDEFEACCDSVTNTGICRHPDEAYFIPSEQQDTSNIFCKDRIEKNNIIYYIIFSRVDTQGSFDVLADLILNEEVIFNNGVSLGGILLYAWPSHKEFGIDNLINNPGFDFDMQVDNAIGPWSAKEFATIDLVQGIYGEAVQVQVFDSSGSSGLQYSDPNMISVKPNTNYVISAMVEAGSIIGGDETVMMRPICHDAAHSGVDNLFSGSSVKLEEENPWTRLQTIIHTANTADHCHVEFVLEDEVGSFFVDNVQFEEGNQLSGFKPVKTTYDGSSEFYDVDSTNANVGSAIAFVAYFDNLDAESFTPYDLNVEANMDSNPSIRAETFSGIVNLNNSCDSQSNQVVPDGRGFTLKFNSLSTKCVEGAPCSSNSNCASGLTCVNNYCSGDGS